MADTAAQPVTGGKARVTALIQRHEKGLPRADQGGDPFRAPFPAR
jgi:hypothetical protein